MNGAKSSATVENQNEQVWRDLARFVTERRTELGLSQKQAAKAANVGLEFWGRIELARKQAVRRMNIYKIEDVLGWERGSVEAIISGGEPSLVPQAEEEAYAQPVISALVNRIVQIEDRVKKLEAANKRIARLIAGYAEIN